MSVNQATGHSDMPFVATKFISAVQEKQANKGGGNDLYLNPSSVPDGETVRFSPLGDSSLAYAEIWGRTSEGKSKPIRFAEEPTAKELADRAADEGVSLVDKQGNPSKLKQALAMFVWNYSTSSVQLLAVTQTSILETIASLFSDEDVADNPGAWDLDLSRHGTGLDTRYTLTLKPGRRKGTVKAEVDAAWDECVKKGYNLSALLVNGDPTKPAAGLF
jgi:hypothetical protein